MSKKTKTWLIVGSALVVVGFLIFGGVMMKLKWDFSKLSTVSYQTSNYEFDQNIKNILIDTNTADIVFLPSEISKTSVVCYEQKNIAHSVSVNGDTLEIRVVDTRKWYEYIGISFGSTKITVYLPNGEYNALNVKDSTGNVKITNDFSFKTADIVASTGDITAQNISAEEINLAVSTGKICVDSVTCKENMSVEVSTGKTKLSNVKCNKLASTGNTGDITLENVIVEEKIALKRSTGDIEFRECDAKEIVARTSTGDIKGTLLTDKIFIAQTDTGRVDVPKTTSGGKCELTTDTGDIKIKIK